MSKKKKILLFVDFIMWIILIGLDAFTKHIAVLLLKDKNAYPIIDKILEFNYLENKGAAFGMLENQKWFFVFVAIIILGAIFYILIKTPDHKMYTKLHILLVMIASGAVGNMIDRIRLNYVVDFIYVKIIDFPIFNVADIYVTVGTFFLIICMLFVYKEKDLEFISFKTKKYREVNK